MKSTPYWTPARSEPGHVELDRVHRPGRDRDRVEVALELVERDVRADRRVEHEVHAEALDQPDVLLDGLAREPEGRHADEHRAAGVGQAVVDRDRDALEGQLASDGQPGRAGSHDRDPLGARGDLGHRVGDAGRLVPLHEEPLHGPDRQRPVDVAAAAGPLARGGADVGAHRRDRVRVAAEDVALFEPAFGGEVQVAAAVRADGTRFLTLDVALEPGRVHRLDEELLVGVDGHELVVPLLLVGSGQGCTRERRGRLNQIYHPRRSRRKRPGAGGRCSLGTSATVHGRVYHSPSRDVRPPSPPLQPTSRRAGRVDAPCDGRALAQGTRPVGRRATDRTRRSAMLASDVGLLALGGIVGLFLGAALIVALRTRPSAPRQIRLTVTPGSVPIRPSRTTLAGDPFAPDPRWAALGGRADASRAGDPPPASTGRPGRGDSGRTPVRSVAPHDSPMPRRPRW